ncbi:MAG TPA: ATP-binding protein [Hyphomicrobiaceae bacterium]|nr:ATP-binding protein [Hyphomicrobiaceae bacterium]
MTNHHRQVSDLIRGRLSQSREAIAVAALTSAILVWIGGLTWWLAALGPAIGAIWVVVAAFVTPTTAPSLTRHDSSAADPGRPRPSGPGWLAVVDMLPDPVLTLDRSGRVTHANTAALALFPGAPGRHVAQLHRSPELFAAIDRAWNERGTHTFAIHDVVPHERHLSGIVATLGDGAVGLPEPVQVVILRDRTEAELAAEMRADFVANASHELRTPLAALKGFIETLQGAAKDDPVARDQFLGIMQEQAARMSRLIDDLLSLSRIEMREHVAPTGRVDLNAAAAEAVALLRPLAESGTITLTLAPVATTAIAAGDHDEIVQVAQNLIQNAIKYGRRGGKVDVSVLREQAHVSLRVSDDGIGIAPEHLPRLTERFYRVSARESRERGGTGLGLAIVKHIVNRHRGELEIDSQPGRGSIFTVRLLAAT